MSTLALATQAATATARAAAASLAAPAIASPAAIATSPLSAPSIDSHAAPALPPLQAGIPPHPAPAIPTPLASTGSTTTTVENALTALVRYIPAEVVTLYVAAVSVGSAFESVIPAYTPTLLYWAFVTLTPIIFYLVYLNQLAAMKQPLTQVKNWPRWKPAASTVAFGVWALAIPTNPYIEGEAGAAVAGFAALFVSMILSLIAPIVERPS